VSPTEFPEAPGARSKALAGALAAIEAGGELARFAHEGAAFTHTAFAISVGEKLADAARLAIVAQGGPEDEEEGQFLAAIVKYLGLTHADFAAPAAEIQTERVSHPRSDPRCPDQVPPDQGGAGDFIMSGEENPNVND